MKKQLANGKLSLNRETLAALQPHELDAVNGAFWGTVIKTVVKVSQWACTTVTTIQSQRIITCK